MKRPTKVIIEITDNRHVTRVFAGQELLTERGWNRTDTGSKADRRGDFHDDFKDFDEFAEALEDANPYEIMSNLAELDADDFDESESDPT